MNDRHLDICGKRVNVERSPVLFDRAFTRESLHTDWQIRDGEWSVDGDWLTGRNPNNAPGMITSRREFFGNVLLEFEARTIPPCTHDIDFMFNGSWDDTKKERGLSYVVGLWGWWEGKIGIEKPPEYRLLSLAPAPPIEPGRVYQIAAGNIDGHLFVFLDGRLMIELLDPTPIDTHRHGMIGFEAYASAIQVRRPVIRQIVWENRTLSYGSD